MLGSPPALVFATPRKLPRPNMLDGRVVVLDIAFAAEGTGASFEKVTEPLIKGLGNRLAAWVDHHDHAMHARYRGDKRFVLATKQQHPACPEMVTPDVVGRAGSVDTIVCHNDLDGIYSAAKWMREGVECYPGADADARAVDTRVGEPGPLGTMLDRALRARPRDDTLRERIVYFLAQGATDARALDELTGVAEEFAEQETNARTLASGYQVRGDVAVLDATRFTEPYDKTLALLLGQERAVVAVLYDAQTVTLAAPFDSGRDFLAMLGISGGMPTRVSVPRTRLDEVLAKLAGPTP